MGGAGVIVAVFLAFSMAMSWVSGDKQNEGLEDKVAMSKYEKNNAESLLAMARMTVVGTREDLAEAKERGQKVERARKKMQRELLFEKRQRRRAVKLGSALDLDVAREDLRKEVEVEARQEITELLDKIDVMEQSRSTLEEELRLKIEEEAQAKTEAALAEADLATVKAEEAAIDNEALQDRLMELERNRKEIEYERRDLAGRLENEQASREYMEARLKDAEASLASAMAAGSSDGVSAGGEVAPSGYDEEAWEQAELARVRAEDVVIKNEELIDRLRRMERNLEDASDALKDKEKDREELATSLRDEQEVRADLEDKLIEAEEALELARSNRDVRKEEEDDKDSEALPTDSAPVIKEDENADVEALASLEKSRNDAVEKLVDKEIEVQDLTTKFEDLNIEVESVRTSVEEKGERIATLEKELKDSKRVGDTLRIEAESNIEKLILMERQLTSLRDAAGLAERIEALDRELGRTLEEKEGLGEATALEIKSLMLASQEFKQRNMELDRSLQETQKALDEAMAAKKLAKELMDRNAELEARFKEAGLVTIEGETLDAVALKLVERNKEIEMLLKETERKLAGAEARAKAAPLVDKDAELTAELKETESSVVELKVATDRMEVLDKRNVELEAMILEAQESLAVAEAEIANFTPERLDAEKAEIEAGIKEVKEANIAGDIVVAELKLSNERLEDRLAEELSLNEDYKVRLQEFEAGMAESDSSVDEAEAARMNIDKDLTVRIEAASILETKLKEYQARDSANMARIDGLEQAAEEIAEEHAAEIEAIRARDAELLEKAELARVALERKLAARIEAHEAAVAGNDTILLRDTELAKAELVDRLAEESELKEHYKARIAQLESDLLISAEIKANEVVKAPVVKAVEVAVTDDMALEDVEPAGRDLADRLAEESELKEHYKVRLMELEAEHEQARLSNIAARDKFELERAGMEERLSVAMVQREAAEGRIRELEAARDEADAAYEKVESARVEVEGKLGKDSVAHKVAVERVKKVESVRDTVAAELDSVTAEVARLEDEKKIDIKEIARKADKERAATEELKREEFLARLVSGGISDNDIDGFMDRFGDSFDTYVVKKGDSLWSISSKDDVYGDPYKWPLLYKYNTRNLSSPDAIEPGSKLVIYNDAAEFELMDADRKARFRGDWKDWDAMQRKSWMDDWIED